MKRIKHKIIGAFRSFAWAGSAFFASAMVAHAAEAKLDNPLNKTISSIPDFIAGVLKVVVMIALPIIVLFIVVSGFMFLFAQGNQGRLDRAKENFLWVIVGTLLILGAWVLATLLAGTVTQLLGKP